MFKCGRGGEGEDGCCGMDMDDVGWDGVLSEVAMVMCVL